MIQFITKVYFIPSRSMKKLLKFDHLKQSRMTQFIIKVYSIPSPCLKKSLKFNHLKQSRMTQFITKVYSIPSPWLKKILKFKCQMKFRQYFLRWQLNEIPGQFKDIWVNSGKFQDFQGHSRTFWVFQGFQGFQGRVATMFSTKRKRTWFMLKPSLN